MGVFSTVSVIEQKYGLILENVEDDLCPPLSNLEPRFILKN